MAALTLLRRPHFRCPERRVPPLSMILRRFFIHRKGQAKFLRAIALIRGYGHCFLGFFIE